MPPFKGTIVTMVNAMDSFTMLDGEGTVEIKGGNLVVTQGSITTTYPAHAWAKVEHHA